MIITLFLLVNLYGYQQSFLNLVSPSELQNLETEIGISHRFNGKFDDKPLDTMFGLDSGANVAVHLRQALPRNFELKLGFIRTNHEYQVELSNHFTPVDFPVQAQAGIQYFSFQDIFDPALRHKNLLYQLSLQNKPILDRLILNINLGYDSEYKRLGNGFGIGLKATDKMTLIGEYYPVWDRDSAPQKVKIMLGKYDCYAMGVKLDTYGHHFMFMLSNNEKITPRHLSMGSYFKKDLKLGFNIQRQMNFF